MISVIVTNRKWGEAADGTGTRIGICLINKWKVRINWEGIYNVRAKAPKRGAKKPWYPNRERNRKNRKLHGQDPWVNLVHLCVPTMNTMINHCPVTKT